MKAITPNKALQQLVDNDPTLTEVDLSANATYSMKTIHFTKEIANALKTNIHLKKLTLASLGITDSSIQFLAEALKVNKTLAYLNVSKNNFGSDGLIFLAEALVVNSTLLEIDLLGQNKPFGDTALSKIIQMFNYNITLRSITWRLQSRQSFAINKLIIRNIEISKRLAAGKSVLDILPEPRRPEFGGESSSVVPVVATATVHSPATTFVSVSFDGDSTYGSSNEDRPIERAHSKPDVSIEPKVELKSQVSQPQIQTKPSPESPNTAVSTKTTQNKMLNRYLQAAQQTTDSTIVYTSKNVTSNSASKRSFFEKRINEEAEGAAKLSTRQPVTRVATTNNTKPSPPMVENEDKESSETLRASGKVASIWKEKFEVNNNNQTTNSSASSTTPGATGLFSPRTNKVAEKWTPKEEAVKKTEIDPIETGATKVASQWKQILENEDKKIQEESSKIPAGKRGEKSSDQTNPQSQPETTKIEVDNNNEHPETTKIEVDNHNEHPEVHLTVNHQIEEDDHHPVVVLHDDGNDVHDSIQKPLVMDVAEAEIF